MDALISKTITFVKQQLSSAEGGHDWFHFERVWKITLLILEQEKANKLICELAALLHDVADSKFHGGDEELGPAIAGRFLEEQQVDTAVINEVKLIIKNMSYKASLGQVHYRSKEMEVVQDADRLDAIGAIGIDRAFNYGGFKNRALHDPTIKPEQNLCIEAYKNTQAPTINHFYEKLLLLKDKMNTDTAKAIAQQRHSFMESFLEQFYAEWEGRR